MDMRVRRASLPAALAAAFLVLLGWHAVPARAASVDPELIVESVTEDGYYVDSSATYLKSDADLDRLRAALQQAGRAGVVVLPAGTAIAPVMSRLLQSPNHKATYVVLSGSQMQAASNGLSKATVDRMVAKASAAGTPKAEVLSFLSQLSPTRRAHSTPTAKDGNVPNPIASDDPSDSSSVAPSAAKKDGSGSNVMLYAIGALVVVVVVGAGGFLVSRRKRGSATPGL
jgi:hypothetical protein